MRTSTDSALWYTSVVFGSSHQSTVEVLNVYSVELHEYLSGFTKFTGLHGGVRLMYIDQYPAILAIIQQYTANNDELLAYWETLHLALRVALLTGREPGASAALTLLAGTNFEASPERRCLTFFDFELRPLAYDRVRAMLHTDYIASTIKFQVAHVA
ncbi:uncharacterized protein LOC144146503 [Haemaphysalis longicornis]